METTLQKVRIYSDGSSKGNKDGPGGYGVIVQYLSEDNKTERVMEYTDGFTVTTNNRMELMGVIIGIESLTTPCEVMIFSDSKYVVDAFNHRWIDTWQTNGWLTSMKLPVKNIDLWKRLLAAKESHKCKFAWVKGHDGHPENERCDYLAQSSANGVEFTRQEDGTLKEVVKELKKDTGLQKSDTESPKITLNCVVKEYVQQLAKDIKNYTITINGAKFIFDEEGNIAPHPEEDLERCEKVFATLQKLEKDEKFAATFRDILFTGGNSSLFCDFSDAIFSQFFTGNKTIPVISVSRGSDK